MTVVAPNRRLAGAFLGAAALALAWTTGPACTPSPASCPLSGPQPETDIYLACDLTAKSADVSGPCQIWNRAAHEIDISGNDIGTCTVDLELSNGFRYAGAIHYGLFSSVDGSVDVDAGPTVESNDCPGAEGLVADPQQIYFDFTDAGVATGCFLPPFGYGWTLFVDAGPAAEAGD